MIIAQVVLAHMIGDYLLQSHWMATKKTEFWTPAIAHALMYTLPFLFLTLNPVVLAIIAGTHLVIDHYRLARHLSWIKNLLAPAKYRFSWRECKVTGYPPNTPDFLAFWLMIITDNLLHILIAMAAIGIFA